MNKVYSIVWSDSRQSYVVTSEYAAARGKPASTVRRVACALAGALIAQAVYAAPAPDALPTGGQVVAGQAAITQNGSAMTIQQGSQQAILNWSTFNIGSQASVNFQQPSSSAVALNRVVGADPSAIYGSLTANGQVYLINPNGVLFAQGASVNVGGIVASTLNMTDADFLAGNNRFTRNGATGSVVNQGTIAAKYVAMLAPEVRNEGVITAQMGTVALAAGDAVTLNITGNNLIDVQVDKASIDTLVENKQLVQANGGTVIMSAQSANQLLGQVVNSGAIDAQGLVSDGGTVRLTASSTIAHSGSINVDAAANGKGGHVAVIADLTNPDSQTTVSGSISARGGSISGDGGFIETSGSHLKIADTATVNTLAVSGKNGQWLLDPNDFVIAPSGGDITGTALTNALLGSSVTITTGNPQASCTNVACSPLVTNTGVGDILVQDTIGGSGWMLPTTLTLSAYRNVDLTNANARIDASFSTDPITGVGGSIVLRADNTGIGTGTVTWNTAKPQVVVGASTGNVDIYYNPTSYASPTDYTNPTTGIVNATQTTFAAHMLVDVNNAIAIAQSKTYDGNTTAALNTPFTLSTITAAGTPTGATLNAGTAQFADKNAALNKTVTFSGYTVSGSVTGAQGEIVDFFLAAQPTSQTANITPATITVTPTSGQTKVYNGQGGTDPALTYNSIASQLFSGDSLTPTGALSRVTGNNVGNHAITLGTLASNNGNYNLVLSGTTVNFAITPATLTYTANAASMTAGGTLPTLSGVVNGFLGTDTLANATTGTLNWSTSGNTATAGSYPINGGGLTANFGNYNFVQASANATALTVAAAAAPAPTMTFDTGTFLTALILYSRYAEGGEAGKYVSAFKKQLTDHGYGRDGWDFGEGTSGKQLGYSDLAANTGGFADQMVRGVFKAGPELNQEMLKELNVMLASYCPNCSQLTSSNLGFSLLLSSVAATAIQNQK